MIDSDGDTAPSNDEQAYRRLRRALMAGAFLPGERLSIRRVAAALDMGMMPVRTALLRLASEKALDVLPSGTAVIPRLSKTAFRHLTAIRLQLEPLAVQFAAPNLRPKCLKLLSDSIDRQNAARERGDPEELLRNDREFLFTIYQASESPMLLSFIENVWLRRSPLFWEARWALLARYGTITRHPKILAALRAKDVESACAELKLEIHSAAEFLLKEIPFASIDPNEASSGKSQDSRAKGRFWKGAALP
ncbi:GntR family transcriptional regulator [Microvirga massiliensis]|uniref:GntR family transcriptional regulator n=1 Tax=Microvirga massiliensis TaxID=1033741 RepID=UPI0006617CCD